MSGITPGFADYRDAYRHIAMERDEQGILLLRFHTDGGPLIWSEPVHAELGHCFGQIAADRDNRVIVMTGTGDQWCAEIDFASFSLNTPEEWDHTFCMIYKKISKELKWRIIN